MKHIPRRIFTVEFKNEAIKLVTQQGLTMAEASKRLDVDSKSIRCWMGQSERGELKATLGANKLTADQLRIRELERELFIAKMERDILKKATALFAREAQSAGCRSEIRHDRPTPYQTSCQKTVRLAECCQEWLSGMELRQSDPAS